MVKILGQEKLLEKLNTYSLATMPRTLLFLGPHGCGKKSVASYLAEKFDMPFVEITGDTTDDDLVEYSISPVPTLYFIKLAQFTDIQQTRFLKFIEEPGEAAYIILTAQDEVFVLPTILNRSIKYQFEPYSTELLKSLSFLTSVTDPDFFEICTTPGDLAQITPETFTLVKNTCLNLATQLPRFSYANVLPIANMINYKDSYDKVDFNFFIKALEHFAFLVYRDSGTELSFTVYNIVNSYKQQLMNRTTFGKESFITLLLTTLWEETRKYDVKGA